MKMVTTETLPALARDLRLTVVRTPLIDACESIVMETIARRQMLVILEATCNFCAQKGYQLRIAFEAKFDNTPRWVVEVGRSTSIAGPDLTPTSAGLWSPLHKVEHSTYDGALVSMAQTLGIVSVVKGERN